MPLFLTFAVLSLAIAVPQTQAPDVSAVPKISEAPNADAGALVTVSLTSTPADPKFEQFLKSLPEAPVQISPDLLQTTLAASRAALPTDTSLAAKLRPAYLLLTPLQRLNNEPAWKYGINPIFWMNRTKSTTLDWWRAYKTTLSEDHLTINEAYPFAYDINTADGSPARNRARALMKQGIDAAMGQGDFVRAEDLLYKSVTADPTYSLAPYNAGVLQMCRSNAEPAIKMFSVSSQRNPPSVIRERADAYRENMRRMIIMLLNNSGAQRRIYTENIDAAWALYNLGQFRAAALFAGQAAALDREERRPEAHFLIAMICAQQNRDAEAVLWLQYTLERCRGASSKIVTAALKEAQASAAPPSAAEPAPAAAPDPSVP